MKISTDFDYTSDQEKEGGAGASGPGRRRKSKYEDDDGTMEGIQQKHRKSEHQLNGLSPMSSRSSSSSSSNSEDEEFLGKNKYKRKTTRKYTRRSLDPNQPVKVRKRRTIKQLTETSLGNIFEDSNDEESSSMLSNEDVAFNTNVLRQQSSNLNLKINPVRVAQQIGSNPSQYTFEQYVKS